MVPDGANTNNLNISKNRNPYNSNGQIKTPVGGRAYFAESHEDFLDRIEHQLENSSSDFETMQDIVVHLGYGSSKFAKDRAKVDFDLENCDEEDNSPGNEVFMGPHQIKDLNFCGFMGGGDWEYPVYFIVYYDGTEWRCYVPDDGNTYDKKTKRAYDYVDDKGMPTVDFRKMLNRIEKRFKL